MREVVFARDLLHERVAVASQPIDRERTRIQHVISPPLPSGRDAPGDHATNLIGCNPLLLQRVPIANRDGAILLRLAVDRYAVRCSDLVLPSVAAADRP